MVCVPTVKVEVVKAACPLAMATVAMVVAPSLNVMLPVTVEGATVAVNVTDCPEIDGFTPETTVVVVDAWVTTCETAVDVLVVKLASPP